MSSTTVDHATSRVPIVPKVELSLVTRPPTLSMGNVRHLLRVIRYRRRRARWGGAAMVARNLRVGLERAGIPYRADPGRRHTRWVGVLGDQDALRWAISRKRRGQVERLI